MRWQHTEAPSGTVRQLRADVGVSRVVAELLAKRNITGADTVHDFLHPKLAHLDDPFAITNMAAAVDRLILALRRNESVAILGDYDVDGVTSTALLASVLRHFGLWPTYCVPRRLEEGYGLTMAALERVLADRTPSLVIALDCGTNSVNEVSWLRQRGIDVLIVDHHRSKEHIPEDCILVNPHVNDPEDAPWIDLCTVGLVFKVAHAFVKRLREDGDDLAQQVKLKDYLDLVALGTVADLVPLTRENRILTRFGLNRLSNSARRGVQSLLQISGLELGQPLEPSDIAYRLGPRINASGRLADAALPVHMLLSDDFQTCNNAAYQLDEYNRERQAIEKQMAREAVESLANFNSESVAITVFGEDWHPGVVGIVAGKLAREFNRPAIALGLDGELAVGSGRSVCGINLQSALARCDHLLEEWGGHPMAVGLTLQKGRIPEFESAFEAAINEELSSHATLEQNLAIDAWVEPGLLNETLLEELDMLRPFGTGNDQPLFAVQGVVFNQKPDCFGDGNFRFQLPVNGSQTVSGIAWRKAETMPPVDSPIDVAIRFYRHHWNGRSFPQAELVDWRPAN